MLPIPAIRRWSISIALSGAERPRNSSASVAPAQLIAERLDAQPLEMTQILEVGALDDVHHAEAAGIVEDHPRSGGKVQHDVIMGAERAARVIVLPSDLLSVLELDAEGSRHAEMHDEDVAVVEIGKQVFGPSGKRVDPPPGQPPREPRWKGRAEVAPVHGDLIDHESLHDRREPETDGFDFWQLRHGKTANPL